jgi:negative regulator of sigma E activity
MALTPDQVLNEVKRVVRSHNKPYDFTIATVVYPDGLVTLRIYEEEIMAFEDEQRANILLHLEKVQNEIRNTLGLRCELEGVVGEPPRKRRV